MNTQTPFIVGEAGPELFVPDRSGVIVSSSMTGPDKILERIKQSRLINEATSKRFNDAISRSLKSILASDELRT